MTTNFTSLGIRPEFQKALALHGIHTPTPVQEQAIPPLMAGKDVVGQAQTGTGKTLAFVLPIVERLEPKRPFTQALIMTPTRELAVQIAKEAERLTKTVEVDVAAIYGGTDVERQIKKLEQLPAIVVGTPGRLLDHVKRGTLSLSGVRFVVVDEADEMMQRGFLEEVETLIALSSDKRQTMLFSATMPQPIRQLSERYMKKPEQLRAPGKQVTAADVEQSIVETPESEKTKTLLRLLGHYRPYLAMVFCSSKGRANAVSEALKEEGVECDALHGELSQAKRENVLKRFREANLQVLVATDIAARGLDIEGVTHVFNYDVPQDVEWYVHRIGRTGRAGESGLAITLATPRDKMRLAKLESKIGMKLPRRNTEGGLLASEVAKKTPGKLPNARQGSSAGNGKSRGADASRKRGGQAGGKQTKTPRYAASSSKRNAGRGSKPN
ncbi:DEAD/DEAH box helicase [Paenibacillus ginsengarvi]|uniref:RNA helicase n=1 Tax=Paenibacillus ginsengarvi TaxID=400777 RepID=A0A3B0ALF3_9BACL|nr:DEAD/DEAH box helicase [Paenibacillus ginsengarvi]RKN61389.1 DEAD/DEAH box helicase [Paenibacillus ginsengarvi]